MTAVRRVTVSTPTGNTSFQVNLEEGLSFRDLIGPDLARLIHVGSHRMLDTNHMALNIDQPIPQESSTGTLEVYVEPREVGTMWINSHPVLRTRALLVLAGDKKHEDAFGQMVGFLHGQGIPVVGFRSIDRLCEVCENEVFRGPMKVGGLLCDASGADLVWKQRPELIEQDSRRRLLLGWAFELRTAAEAAEQPWERFLKEVPWTVCIPSAYSGPQEIENACRRVVAALNYDSMLYDTSSKVGDLRKRIRDKSLEWLPKVAEVDARATDAGLTEFLWKTMPTRKEQGTHGTYHLTKLIHQVLSLKPYCEAIGESLDVEDGPLVFTKATELVATQMVA